MNERSMSRMSLVVGIAALLLGVVVLVFADGLRRWYSGLFFLLIGTVTLLNHRRWRRDAAAASAPGGA